MATTTTQGTATPATASAATPDSVADVRTTAGPLRSTLLLAAGSALAAALNAVVALAAVAAGASPAFGPLGVGATSTFTVLGLLIGYAGWRLIRARSRRPAATLSWLVPTLLVASLVPDVLVLGTGAIPGASATAVVALMIMHVVVVVVGVPVYRAIAPVLR